MSQCQSVLLADVAKVFNGKTPSKTEQRDEGHPVLKIKSVSELGKFRGSFDSFVDDSLAEKYVEKQVKQGDILILNAAHNADYVGSKVYRAEPPTYTSLVTGEWLIIRPSQELSASYVYHWVTNRTTRKQIRGLVNGIHLYPKDVARLKIPLPSLLEQRRIAAILDQADALRTKRREALAQLDKLTQSIFMEMFGDPASNPKNWPVVCLGDLIHSAQDGPHVSPTYTDIGIPFLSTRHVRPGEISCNDLKYISQEDAEIHWKKCKPERGDILYTKGGTTGLAAVVKTDMEFAIWVHVALLKPNRELIDSIWLESMLNNQYCYRQSQVLTRGIANRDLGLKRMVKIKLYQPPLDIQREFALRTEKIAHQKKLQQLASVELDKFFSSLQHRAFRGEL